jgi:hypothetical protein
VLGQVQHEDVAEVVRQVVGRGDAVDFGLELGIIQAGAVAGAVRVDPAAMVR